MSRFLGLPRFNVFPKSGPFGHFSRSPFTNGQSDSRLVETEGFGSNPGDLKMYSFVPHDLPQNAGLVVVLHGCTQTAAAYDVGMGWSALAERYGFALLMPEQKQTNNANRCFSWFNPEDCRRDEGEAFSIRQMIARMEELHSIDPKKVFVTGLSAGGAMTSVMLATYPEIFAAGAIIAGLPYGIASNVEEAFRGMHQKSQLDAGALGDMVRSASHHKGPWPRVSVWHGGLDLTVNPSNASAIVNQWLDVHGLPSAPMSFTKDAGRDHAIWWNADGETMVELYNIAHMPHGASIGVGEDDEYFGAVGPFLIDAGISSTYNIASFFGLTDKIHQSRTAADNTSTSTPQVLQPGRASGASGGGKSYKPMPAGKINVGEVITRALTAAGLIK
jgi:poly(hydroxyalkanoate) depolymerase family esterase